MTRRLNYDFHISGLNNEHGFIVHFNTERAAGTLWHWIPTESDGRRPHHRVAHDFDVAGWDDSTDRAVIARSYVSYTPYRFDFGFWKISADFKGNPALLLDKGCNVR